MKLPVIVERNILTLPQERYNADWVLEQGAGLVLPNFRHVQEAVGRLLASLDDYRGKVAKIENRAVFEHQAFGDRLRHLLAVMVATLVLVQTSGSGPYYTAQSIANRRRGFTRRILSSRFTG